jgi:Alpha/beta hydrolase of unknown function (DUF900)
MPNSHHQLLSVLTFGVVILLLTASVLSSGTAYASITAERIDAYEITTRENLDNKPLKVEGPGYQGRYLLNDTEELYSTCPDEVAIIVHGWGLNETLAKERFDRVKMSLENQSYIIPVVGFSWNSNITWWDTQSIAKENGPKLADFIFNLESTCKQQPHNKEVKIRLVGHSLGSRVILSSLDSLHNNSTWNNNNFKIESVHLMAAAVDNEEVSKNQLDILNDPTNWGTVKMTAYGEAIDEEVVDFYNLYNTEDNTLEPNPFYPFYPYQIYPSYEGDWALGQSGHQTIPYDISSSLPTNYIQINVQNEIPPICDVDGDKHPDFPLEENMVIKMGDNHGGYFGFRDAANNTRLVDNGAINVVVDNWKNLTPTINQPVQLTTKCN